MLDLFCRLLTSYLTGSDEWRSSYEPSHVCPVGLLRRPALHQRKTVCKLDVSALLCGLQVQSLPACSNEHALVCRQALTDITARVLSRKK